MVRHLLYKVLLVLLTRHIYICKYWSDQSEHIQFNMIYTDDMPKLVKVYKQFEMNYKRREELKNNIENEKEKTPHVIHQSDPLSSIVDYGNGNKH